MVYTVNYKIIMYCNRKTEGSDSIVASPINLYNTALDSNVCS